MSAVMRDWIRPIVCKQLGEALKGTGRHGEALTTYSADGTFMIHITDGKLLQVNEFINHASPYEVLVSDSFTQIRAVFTKSGTDKYLKTHKRSFSTGTNGAVLGITDYYLAFNPKSPPSQRIILRIEGFSVQGGEGSGNFGHPVPIEGSEDVAKLLSRLSKNSDSGKLSQSSSLGPLPQIQSQASISTDDTSHPGSSAPARFSTQAPTNVSNETVVGRLSRDTAATNQALMALLNRTKGLRTTTRNSMPARISELSHAQKLCGSQANGGSDSASPSSFTSAHFSSMPSTSTLAPVEPQVMSKKNRGHLQVNMPLSQGTSQAGTSSGQRVGKAVDDVIDEGLLSQKTSSTEGIEISIAVHGDGDKSHGYNGIISKLHRKLDTMSQPIPDTDNPWEGFTRIPRKYVQIPKDQRDILERDDAWYTQVLDDRQPSVRVPIKVRKEVQAFHDKLGNKIGKGECDGDGDSDDDNDTESSNDNQSNSYDEHSESQKDLFVKDSRGMKELLHRSISSKSLPLSKLAPSNPCKAMKDVGEASSEPISSDKDYSSVEDGLDFTEIEPEHEMGFRNTEGSCIQLDKILPNVKILLDTRVDVPSASPDHEDGNSADEGMSWSSSPDRVEVHSSRHHSSQDELQVFTEEQVNGQASLTRNSPISLLTAETPSMEEGDADSDINPFSILQNQPEHHPTRAAERMTRALKPGLGGSGGIFSSSPVEMELLVPHTLGNQTQPPDDLVIIDMSNSGRGQPHSSSDIDRSSYVYSGSRSPRGNSYNMKSVESSLLRQRRANISSDPIIPGTFRSEASNAFTGPVERVSVFRQNELKGNIFEADQVVSATPGPPTQLHLDALAPADEEEVLAQRWNQSEPETPTQMNFDGRDGKDTYPVENATKTPVRRQRSCNSNHFETPTSPTVHEPSKSSISGSQVSTSESLPPSPHAPIGGKTILSTLAMPIKRRASGVRDMIEPSPKRRRNLQAVIFDSALEKDLTIDPTEMAKANRRKFLQELSLNSQIQSPQRLQEENASPLDRTTATVPEILLENTLGRDSIRAWNSDVSPPSPPHVETETPSVHSENSSLEKSQDGLLDHPRYDTYNGYREDPREGSNGNRSIQNQVTRFSQSEDTPTFEKGLSGNEHPSQTETIFDIFNKIYPNYGKSLRAFIRACVCLDWLNSTREAPHPSLWDDFIRAFSAEFLSHIKECQISKQKPIPAPEFYNIHVPEPVFMRRVMNPARLQDALLLDPDETAKCRAKTHREKHQNSQESISITSSQSTIGSKILAERQDTPSAFHEVFSSPQQLPNTVANMSRSHSDHAENVEMVLKNVLGAVSAPNNIAVAKRPFFETPSQLISEARHNKISTLSRSDAAKEVRVNAIRKDPPERVESPDVEIVPANVIKQTPRHLPWSSLSEDKFEPRDPIDVNGAIPGLLGARCWGRSSRQSGLVNSLPQREGSPILGSMASSSYSTEGWVVQSEISPALTSNSGIHQDHIFKTPHLPASKSLGRRKTSMPGRSENGVDEWRVSHLLRTAKAQNQIIPTVTATFKDFSKAFVPHQKRQSSVFSRVSTPSSNAIPGGTVASNTLGSKLTVEPDTQAWRF